MAKTLPQLRTQIDSLDLELLALLNQRAKLAHEVGEIMRVDGSAVFRPDRETQIINPLQASNPGPLFLGNSMSSRIRSGSGACANTPFW